MLVKTKTILNLYKILLPLKSYMRLNKSLRQVSQNPGYRGSEEGCLVESHGVGMEPMALSLT